MLQHQSISRSVSGAEFGASILFRIRLYASITKLYNCWPPGNCSIPVSAASHSKVQHGHSPAAPSTSCHHDADGYPSWDYVDVQCSRESVLVVFGPMERTLNKHTSWISARSAACIRTCCRPNRCASGPSGVTFLADPNGISILRPANERHISWFTNANVQNQARRRTPSTLACFTILMSCLVSVTL